MAVTACQRTSGSRLQKKPNSGLTACVGGIGSEYPLQLTAGETGAAHVSKR
jgi:hypothetical protein